MDLAPASEAQGRLLRTVLPIRLQARPGFKRLPTATYLEPPKSNTSPFAPSLSKGKRQTSHGMDCQNHSKLAARLAFRGMLTATYLEPPESNTSPFALSLSKGKREFTCAKLQVKPQLFLQTNTQA